MRTLGFIFLVAILLQSTRASALEYEAARCAMHAYDEQQQALGVCPLKHTDVKVAIAGFGARVTVTQRFENPFNFPIEAQYIFPLSSSGAVNSMTMRIGNRVIEGKVKPSEEARQEYEQARASGRTASLLAQQRPNVFSQSVANILPGEDIEVVLTYVETLPYQSGEYTFSFPMTIGPRYNPGQPLPGGGTTEVPDSATLTPPTILRPGHEVSLELQLDAGVTIETITSELHKVDIKRDGPARASVRLQSQREIPNRDFIFRYRVNASRIEDALLSTNDAEHAYFSLLLHPPVTAPKSEIVSKEIVFVIDCSGSMSGYPIEKAKETMRRCIEQLTPDDTFNLISFSGGAGHCFAQPVANNRANRATALAYLDNLRGSGGTEMMKALRAAFSGAKSGKNLRVVCFMTDGFIGNDMEILAEVQRNADYVRVFSFGIGNSVNRFLIEGMAREGRGGAEIVTLETESAAAVERFQQRVQSPVLTNIRITSDDINLDEVYPPVDQIPDLFAGQPLHLLGRLSGVRGGSITVHGTTTRGTFSRTLHLAESEEQANSPIATLWARAKVDALMASDWQGIQQGRPEPTTKEEITRLGVDYGLLTQYTSFIAVDRHARAKSGTPHTISVPVALPDGMALQNQQLQTLGYLGGAPSAMRTRTKVGSRSHTAANIAMPEAAAAPVSPSAHDFDGAPAMKPTAERPRTQVKSADAAPKPEESRDEQEGKAPADRTKFHPLLQAYLLDPSNSSQLKLEDGKLSVELVLREMNDQHLETLRQAGLDVRAIRASANRLIASIIPESLEVLAKFDFVLFIGPASS